MTNRLLRLIPRSVAAACLTLLTLAACEDETNLPANPALEQRLQQLLETGVNKRDVVLPGAIVHHQMPAYRPWTGAAGLGDVTTKVPLHPHDRIRAGSVLKTFLATVTLQHVETGALSLEQKLPELLPASATSRIAHADQISLRMLLNHTSGIPDWVTSDVEARVATEPGHIWSTDEVLEIVSQLPPTFTPGASWSYSNTNYTLVGLVLDRAGGKSWRAQVRERVIARLGLHDTALPEPGDRSMGGSYAHGYHVLNDELVDLTAVDPSMAGAAGGHALITTARDLGRFIDQLLSGALFARADTLATMTTMVDAPDPSGLPHRYGLGLEEFRLPNGTVVVGHSGSTAGYAVMMFRMPAQDTTVVTAVNTSNLFTNALELFLPTVEVIAASARP